MKTQFTLLLLTEGRPTMTHEEFAHLRNKSPRTVQNEIYNQKNPVPFWQDGGSWQCHVSDVADWLDRQRDEAIRQQTYLHHFEKAA